MSAIAANSTSPVWFYCELADLYCAHRQNYSCNIACTGVESIPAFSPADLLAAAREALISAEAPVTRADARCERLFALAVNGCKSPRLPGLRAAAVRAVTRADVETVYAVADARVALHRAYVAVHGESPALELEARDHGYTGPDAVERYIDSAAHAADPERY
jgi:hypothetical protein